MLEYEVVYGLSVKVIKINQYEKLYTNMTNCTTTFTQKRRRNISHSSITIHSLFKYRLRREFNALNIFWILVVQVYSLFKTSSYKAFAFSIPLSASSVYIETVSGLNDRSESNISDRKEAPANFVMSEIKRENANSPITTCIAVVRKFPPKDAKPLGGQTTGLRRLPWLKLCGSCT